MLPVSTNESNSPLLPPEEQHAFILRQIQDIIVTADVDFRVLSFNEVAARFFGFSAEEALGRRMTELVRFDLRPGESLSKIGEQLATTGRWQGELSFIGRDGIQHVVDFLLTHLPRTDAPDGGILVIGRDRTAERAAEQQLQRRERFYRGLIADALDGILLTDRSGYITFASPSIRNVLGYDYTELLGKEAFHYVHPEDRERAATAFFNEVALNADLKFIDIRLRGRDGSWVWCLVRGNNLLANPSVNGIAIYFHNDTQRRQATEALRESEQRFRTLIQDIQMGVLLQDSEARIELCNKAAIEFLDLSEDQLMGRTSFDSEWNVIRENGEEFPGNEHPVPTVIRTGKTVRNVVMGVFRPTRRDRVWLLVNAVPVLDPEGKLLHVICTFTDISERRELEARLLAEQIAHQRALTQATIDSSEKQRTEIGKELHDNIGQQLTTIKLYLDLAKETADEETLEMVGLANRSISDVINDIRGLCRALIPSTLGDLGLVESINDLLDTVRRTQTLRIRFQVEEFTEESIPDNRKLMLFRILQEQLNNIQKHAAATRVDILLSHRKGATVLQVIDDGRGFDPASVRRGIGLTNMSNRAEMFGGKVDVKSAPGKGCTLIVSLPPVTEEEQKNQE